jgi:hypothetical protein
VLDSSSSGGSPAGDSSQMQRDIKKLTRMLREGGYSYDQSKHIFAARSLVFEWAAEHQEELLRCRELAQEPAPLPKLLRSTKRSFPLWRFFTSRTSRSRPPNTMN